MIGLDLSTMGITKNKVRVFKVARGFGCEHCAPVHEKPWFVSAPNWPQETFATWDEAMAHARRWRRPVMMNGAADAISASWIDASQILLPTVNEIRRLEGLDAA